MTLRSLLLFQSHLGQIFVCVLVVSVNRAPGNYTLLYMFYWIHKNVYTCLFKQTFLWFFNRLANVHKSGCMFRNVRQDVRSKLRHQVYKRSYTNLSGLRQDTQRWTKRLSEQEKLFLAQGEEVVRQDERRLWKIDRPINCLVNQDELTIRRRN